ncbi:hypothetical protein [Rosettibacter firmus]|uniref:hypothetical protein n=1 Tax=Rosettibacter firmus TaxID=3111522 RepID=UPI00336BE2D9
MKKIVYFCFVIFFGTLLVSNVSAQSKELRIGKIFAKEEANQLFGKPSITIPVRKDLLKAALAKADKYVFFSLKGKLPLILNSRRISLLGDNVSLSANEKAFVFSKEVVEEFLNSSKSSVIYFEIRGLNNLELNTTATSPNAVFSLSDGVYTLEASMICPPACI